MAENSDFEKGLSNVGSALAKLPKKMASLGMKFVSSIMDGPTPKPKPKVPPTVMIPADPSFEQEPITAANSGDNFVPDPQYDNSFEGLQVQIANMRERIATARGQSKFDELKSEADEIQKQLDKAGKGRPTPSTESPPSTEAPATPSSTETPPLTEAPTASTPSTPHPAIATILRNEGGFQNDPNDSGNFVNGRNVGTNLGVTAKALAVYRGVDVSTITEKDIRDLTEEEATALYERDFIKAPKFDTLPESIKNMVIDFGVNAGTGQSARILQELAGIEVDGIVGATTAEAAKKVTPEEFAERLREFYKSIAIGEKKAFLKGWLTRVDKMEKEQIAANKEREG